MKTYVDVPQSKCRFALVHADITPPENIYHRMWGAATQDRATGIHRPLRGSVALLAPTEGNERQFVIALDHCVMGRQEMENLLREVSNLSGVKREELIVVFSHTHAAGLMGLERVNLPGGDLIPAYLDELNSKIAALVREAESRLEEVTILYGTGNCNLAAHRDFWDEENQTWACGYNPGKSADDTVMVARIDNAEGKVIATLVNYACHPTTLAWDNSLISPDYPGAMRETVENATGAPCLFIQGASAELGPVEGFVGDPAVADRNGRQLAYSSLAALESLPKANKRFSYAGPVVSGATLGNWTYTELSASDLERNASWDLHREDLNLSIRPGTPTIEEVKSELAEWQEKESEEAHAMAERKLRLLHRLKQLPSRKEFPLESIVLKIGGAVWVILQGELYSVLQTTLRERFPDTAIVVSTIASHWGASYLPPRELYDTGIYQESIAITAAGSLETVIETISEKIENLLK